MRAPKFRFTLHVILFAVFAVSGARADTNFAILKYFGLAMEDGQFPAASVIQASDGAFYGTTLSNLSTAFGVVYKVSTDGTFSTLYTFTGAPGDGQTPRSRLVEGVDGALYGTTTAGGTNNFGTVFKVNKDGTGYSVLHVFTGPGNDGRVPYGLTQCSDGLLYGVCSSGGTNNRGTIYSLSLDGSSYQIIYQFKSAGNDGSLPFAPLTEASDGFLYGTTRSGGTNSAGTVFKINKDGSNYQRLYSFRTSGGDGQDPYYGPVIEGPGFLYGTTYSGGSAGFGTLYRIGTDGSSYFQMRSFGNGINDIRHPWHLMLASDGLLYGVGADGAGTTLYGAIFGITTFGATYTLIHPFGAPTGTDGSAPQAGLVEAFDGMLYGATIQGGAGAGTLYRVNKDGSGYNILHNFAILAGDGKNSQAALLQATNSILYGTTSAGGISNKGTVFSIQKDGKGYQILHSFTGSAGDGFGPHGSLIEASDGMLYGSTVGSSPGLGTLFQIGKDGSSYNVLHNFASGEGQATECALIEGTDGMLYGTARVGGTGLNFGTIFTIAKDGNGFAVLHSFTNGIGDGSQPYASVIEVSDGTLFGSTSSGGAGTNGTIFKLEKNGDGYGIVHHFVDNHLEGASPRSALLCDSNGILYGTAFAGGNFNKGTVFRLDQDGSGFTVLHHFGTSGTDASSPLGSLIEGNDGILYGTSQLGGANATGAIFRLNKDGANYAVVRSFNTTFTRGINLYSALTKMDDGALCGTTYSGGSFSSGIIFRILTPQVPVITNFSYANGSPRLTLLGTSGYNYSVLRSTNLTTWSPVTTNVMPAPNSFTFQDPNPSKDKSFYRAAWIP